MQPDHLSYTQLSTYMKCPLQYRFAYSDCLPREQEPAALPFGSAIHCVLGDYYRALARRHPLTEEQVLSIFEKEWGIASHTPLIAWNGTSAEKLMEQGKEMLRAYLSSNQPQRVVSVEHLFSIPVTVNGWSIDLIGSFDLVMEDEEGNLVIVDHKTASRRYSQSRIDEDLQFTVYSLAAEHEFPNGSDPLLRYDVLLKTTKPDVVRYHTIRTQTDRQRLIWTMDGILSGIQAEAFFPNPGYYCKGCMWERACQRWGQS